MTDPNRDLAYRLTVEERIRELWARRQWYRDHLGWIPEQQTDDRRELRIVVRLAREARRHQRNVEAAMDAMTQAKAAADRAYYAGDHHVYPEDFNIEGQPEFNGAFR